MIVRVYLYTVSLHRIFDATAKRRRDGGENIPWYILLVGLKDFLFLRTSREIFEAKALAALGDAGLPPCHAERVLIGLMAADSTAPWSAVVHSLAGSGRLRTLSDSVAFTVTMVSIR